MRPLVVVEAQVALERGLELAELREVATTKLDAPMLVQDRLLEPLNEAVGEGVPRFRPRVADDGILSTGFVEGTLELAAPVGEDPLHGMPRLAEVRDDSLPEEVGGEDENVAQYRTGIQSLKEGDYEAALDAWIRLIGLPDGRKVDDDGARRACIALFHVLGESHPATQAHRRAFSSALY